MCKPMIRLSVAAITILLAGCSTSNMSKHEYFAPYVGVDSSLQRSMKICETSDDKNYYTYRSNKMVPLEQECSIYGGSTLATIGAGEKVSIQKVLEYSTIGGSGIIALGKVRNIEFEYFWGGRLHLSHAPWEKGEYHPKRCIGTVWISCNE